MDIKKLNEEFEKFLTEDVNVEEIINKTIEEYKDYFSEEQLKEFRKELERWVSYHNPNDIDWVSTLKNSKESILKLKPEEALEKLKRSNDWQQNYDKATKLRQKFYDYVEANDFKDTRINELARFIGGFEGLGIDKPLTFEELKNDNRYGFRTELALKYLADKKDDGFDNYFKDNEEDKVKAGFDKFIEIVYGK